ncbi:acetyl-CoA carboxylase biotin carboxylase subunit [Cupriavidus consociatus]|uniref:acetyl-CoA carboxylase biotin carboxylase subunit n=1 Tax=Cupriavidus consociatus TaxID=2821357 RepID=UPI001AE28A9E|nr:MULTISPECIES: acetyl-CoA carboxylase biotin carboxylase subunit [unclassified Cupriavidus]MBP0623739.1 acetyl-CoA carboxylase biotin carboxylase subunit [Cupriavidus sp. LEh25]MDK2660446.1 acetyl-CoA carboxylase biotin carboxylase subunit [Cupriavidus sp. LEh21]
MTPIHTVLIANRGEIAARIVRTCRRLGKRAVVVYHEADQDSLAVRLADEAYRIDGATPVATYLSIDNILAACRATGADAVHPGFGFLSENAEFARALDEAGIRFIGPGADAIDAMGDKIRSKRIAQEAGVNTIPGYDGEIRNADHALDVACSIGFPVILKASAGGGGKGMRVIHDANPDACRAAFERTTSEAQAAFGDARVFLEKYIERPRHIEIQVLGDQHGNVVHLGERECSIQRRHQKVIEEAPSSFVNASLREAMGAQAVALAREVGYASAGTVEFVVDPSGAFYFLEMNTRIQVEHPVTEMITGLDIVAEQIRIAEGESLGFNQDAIQLKGHAIECRLCAEDAERDFMPATGKLRVFHPPEVDGFRLDAGVQEGDNVTSAFDPMLAKLIVRGATRAEAIERMRAVLARTVVLGVTTNAAYLERVLAHAEFAAGNTYTSFLEEHKAALQIPAPTPEQAAVVLAAALLSNRTLADARFAPPAIHGAMQDWRNE